MKINIRADSVVIEGYVNAVERASKPLLSRFGQFIEKICAGAFGRALERNKDVRIFLNHDAARDLGGTGSGELELYEDNIGLHARATITDPKVIEDARRGNLVGWSFGFEDRAVENQFKILGNLQLNRTEFFFSQSLSLLCWVAKYYNCRNPFPKPFDFPKTITAEQALSLFVLKGIHPCRDGHGPE